MQICSHSPISRIFLSRVGLQVGLARAPWVEEFVEHGMGDVRTGELIRGGEAGRGAAGLAAGRHGMARRGEARLDGHGMQRRGRHGAARWRARYGRYWKK